MKFNPPLNPATGLPAVAIEERLIGWSQIEQDEDGVCHYLGDTEIEWDTQAPNIKGGKVWLQDESGDVWLAEEINE